MARADIEGGVGGRKRYAILRPLRAGERGDDLGEVEGERVGEERVGRVVGAEEALSLRIGLDQCDAVLVAAGRFQIGQRILVDREEAAGRAVLRRHVGDGRLVLERQVGKAGAVELDELVDHALPAQHLGDGQHEVGGGDAFLQPAGQAEANDLGNEHGDRLAEHRGLGLDAADAPAENGEAVDHGGVAVGADERIGIGDGAAAVLGRPHRLRQVFEVDLVADAGSRRDDAEILEGGRAPAQERVALAVALVLHVDVLAEGIAAAEEIDHHRMVDDEIDGDERVDALRVAAELHHGVAHGGEVDDRGHAGEILHQHAGRAEGDFAVALPRRQPLGHGADVVGADRPVILETEQIFEEHLQGKGQAMNAGEAVLLGIGEAVIIVLGAADGEGAFRFERVERRGHVGSAPDVVA